MSIRQELTTKAPTPDNSTSRNLRPSAATTSRYAGAACCLHTSAYVSICEHTSADTLAHSSAYVSIRPHASHIHTSYTPVTLRLCYFRIRQHTPAYASIRHQHTSAAYVTHAYVIHTCNSPPLLFSARRSKAYAKGAALDANSSTLRKKKNLVRICTSVAAKHWYRSTHSVPVKQVN